MTLSPGAGGGATIPPPTPAPPPGVPPYYVPLFEDDFDGPPGSSPNTATWNLAGWWYSQYTTSSGGSDIALPSQCTLDGHSNLVITAAQIPAWSSITAYVVGDCVVSGGASYQCLVANTDVVPPSVTHWRPIGTTPSAWSSTTAYTPGQRVVNGGVAYSCTADNTDEAPPNASYWQPYNTWASGTMVSSLYGATPGASVRPPFYIEYRAKMPVGAAGIWPAIWAIHQSFANTNYEELDVLEQFSSSTVGYASWHSTGSNSSSSETVHGQFDASAAFHSYGAYVTTDTIYWYVDGEYTGLSLPTDIPLDQFCFVINLAVGAYGSAAGGPNNGAPNSGTPNPSVMYVDYLKVWGPPTDPTNGALAPDYVHLAGGAGPTITGGSGAPTIAGAEGDVYFRIDTPTVADQRVYICTVTGIAGASTWVGIV